MTVPATRNFTRITKIVIGHFSHSPNINLPAKVSPESLSSPISNVWARKRLIGTVRREYLDRTFFWNKMDLARKLEEFKSYYHQIRVHQSLEGTTPEEKAGRATTQPLDPGDYRWQTYCHGLFELPIAA